MTNSKQYSYRNGYFIVGNDENGGAYIGGMGIAPDRIYLLFHIEMTNSSNIHTEMTILTIITV